MRAPEFWNGKDYAARFAVNALAPLGWLYGAVTALKANQTVRYRSSAKVVCVGNLTAGGSGKTPISIAIARALLARGKRTVALTRGYGGKMHGPAFVDAGRDSAIDTGDEALLLASATPTIVSRDRKDGAKLAEEHNAQIIVMDDGHQNFSLVKDVSIVVVDADTAFGNGRVLPAGPLREPVSRGLARADAVVLVGDGLPHLNGFTGPVLRARLAAVDTLSMAGKPVLAFAGIGRPEKFFQTLRSLGAHLVGTRMYADHHAYTASEIARLRAHASAESAMLMTTEKDFVRLTPSEREDIGYLPVRAAFDDQAAFDALLDRIAPRTP
ncbi:MAG TPA: tetraacyldisaccharide 4'-kinase [Rhizomicrobium sp.]|nr:tetraacyldisaccharide 4'-kinase [Rhizomicrobium sp.]